MYPDFRSKAFSVIAVQAQLAATQAEKAKLLAKVAELEQRAAASEAAAAATSEQELSNLLEGIKFLQVSP